MTPTETYISDLQQTRLYGGVEETSYYTPLANLLNEVGKSLKPKVRCVVNPKNAGAGIPDGGLFTPDQKNADMIGGQVPSRGVIEVKGFKEDVAKIVDSEQVQRYLSRYGQVLVTNYWDFELIGKGPDGKPSTLESFRLAECEADFVSVLAHPRKAADEKGPLFVEFLIRVLLRAADLAEPKDLAGLLASYARESRLRVEKADLPALDAVRTALEEALGLEFKGEKGDRFFRSTLVQTLFYGIFSAWILWSKENRANPDARFDWRTAVWSLHVPMIRALFEQIATPTKLAGLGLVDILDSAAAALNRVDPHVFFQRFEEQHAVQYFYEPFLEAFDPELRKELGVWYTPPEIVQYMVARVDTVLREELGIADGLADPQVYVLDPACGTGAYLVEVLNHIHKTLERKGGGALVGADVKKAATERVFGFEILPAPFVVAHLQLGLMLRNMGAPLKDDTERAGVYLTNSLTGWEPPTEEAKGRIAQLAMSFPELNQERNAAQRVKQDKPILVIIGNPPYNGYAGMAVSEERDLSDAYRTTKLAPPPQGQGLNDLYVRFFRMAERRIVEGTQKGVVCFISNYSWLDGLSFTGMRERYLEAFDQIWIDNLHGDRIISEYAPDGRTSETIFAMSGTSPGIKIGTAISLLVHKGTLPGEGTRDRSLLYRDIDEARAADRCAALLSSLKNLNLRDEYVRLHPVLAIGLPLKPSAIGADYTNWPLLPDLFPVSFPGVKTSRDDVVVDIDRDRLVRRMEQYFDLTISHEEMRRVAQGVMDSTARFPAESTRDQLRKRGFLRQNIIRYCYRPFDLRWLYWEPETKLLDEKRAEYFLSVFDGNVTLVAQQKCRREWSRTQTIRYIGCLDLMDRGASCFPLRLKPVHTGGSLFAEDEISSTGVRINEDLYNITEPAAEYLNESHPQSLFFHALAILNAPCYAEENSGALRQDWPRIPLPEKKDALLASADLGRQIAALLDTETPVPGVTSGTIRPELRTIGVISREGGGPLNPDTDLAVTAGWGHAGQGGVTMPGKGKSVQRPLVAHMAGADGDIGAPREAVLGDTTLDIYLNDVAYWKNVPAKVWKYTIGGYQVMKKWLSYRAEPLLGRPLTLDEVHEVENMARRIAAIILLEPELDANYEHAKTATYPWAK